MERRIERLLDLMKNPTHELIFIRKGHAPHHHKESQEIGVHIENDRDDAENLNDIINNHYSSLRYKIVVILVCDQCFDKQVKYVSQNANIEIYNCATSTLADDEIEKIVMQYI